MEKKSNLGLSCNSPGCPSSMLTNQMLQQLLVLSRVLRVLGHGLLGELNELHRGAEDGMSLSNSNVARLVPREVLDGRDQALIWPLGTLPGERRLDKRVSSGVKSQLLVADIHATGHPHASPHIATYSGEDATRASIGFGGGRKAPDRSCFELPEPAPESERTAPFQKIPLAKGNSAVMRADWLRASGSKWETVIKRSRS
jgi:hypothetical protein